MPRYAELVYNGFWFSPERLALQAAIDQTQKFVTGTVRVKLYKVNQGFMTLFMSRCFICIDSACIIVHCLRLVLSMAILSTVGG